MKINNDYHIKKIVRYLIEYRPDFRRWINFGFLLFFIGLLFKKIIDGLPLWDSCRYGISNILCISIPLLFFFLQSIYPTLIGWFGFICVALTYAYIDFSYGVQRAIAYYPIKWSKEEAYYSIIGQIVLFTTLVLFMYFLKPRKIKTSENTKKKGSGEIAD